MNRLYVPFWHEEKNMKTLVLKYVVTVAFSALAFAACGGGGGGTEVPANDFEIAPLVSECGGFVAGGTGAKIPQPDPATYCDAERLLWNYDAANKTLGLMNSRIQLNCCGDHSVKVTRDGETVVFTEIDAPPASAGGARCKCNCVFDYAADVLPIENGMTALRIVRNVTDSDPPTKTVWEGTLDLAAGTGEVVVTTDSAEPWCTSSMP
jgi:hypothetical protein